MFKFCVLWEKGMCSFVKPLFCKTVEKSVYDGA